MVPGTGELRLLTLLQMAATMAKIFISYDRASKDIVEELVQDLRDDDHEICSINT
jgi:hypothetical protein